jgi:ATP:ADP antiporter, AAA family
MRYRLMISWAWFVLVLFSYYVLKPVRDGLATDAPLFGPLYLATFVSVCVALPLYWRIVAHSTRRQLVFGTYQFFVACLAGFAVLVARGHGDAAWLRNAFFVWTSVFNVFVVAVFWSVMADLFSAEEGKTWFGSLAAAGTVGSIVASLVGRLATGHLGLAGLMVVAIAALELAIAMAWLVLRLEQRGAGEAPPSSGSLREGLRTVMASRYLLLICAFTAIGKFCATFVYNNFQHALRAEEMTREARTELFAEMSFYSQSGTLVFQAVLAAALMRLAGVGATLMAACAVIVGLFAWLAVDAGIWPLMVAKVVQEIVGYGLLVPAQQVLFTVVSREEKYESKAFIDTVVFRGSDVAAAHVCDALVRFPLSAAAVALVPVAAAWAGLGAWLGREQASRAREGEDARGGKK